ncbi:MAG: CHAT domain-containing protein [Pseudomonadota bacterium]
MPSLSRIVVALASVIAASASAQQSDFVELNIARDAPSSHAITLSAGRTYEVELEQLGINATMTIDSPDETTVGPFNSPLTDRGWETLWYTPVASGEHTVTVRAADESHKTGQVRLRVSAVELQPSEPPILIALTRTAAGRFDTTEERIAALRVFSQAREQLKNARWRRASAFFDHAIAHLHELAERPSEAVAAYARAASAYEQLGARENALWAQYRQASMETFRDNYAASRQLLRAMLSPAIDLGEPSLISATQNYIGVNHYYEGDFDAANQWIRQSLATIEPTGRAHEQATTLYNLAWIRLQAGEAVAALDYFNQALAMDESLGDIDAQIDTRVSIATTYRDMGDCGGAIHQLTDALALTHQHSKKRQLARIHNRAASCYSTLGDFRASTALLRQALEYAKQTENHREHADALYLLGDDAYATGALEDALRLYQAALQARLDIDDHEGVLRCRIRLGDVLLSLGRLDEAAQQLDSAELAFGEIRTISGEADHALVIDKLRHRNGDDKGATTALAGAMRRYQSLHDNVGQLLTYLALAAIDSADDTAQRRAYLDAAIELAEKPHGHVVRPELRARYRARLAEVYFQRAALDVAAFEETTDERPAAESFVAINRGQAQTLAEQRLRRPDEQLVIDAALQDLQRRLTTKLVALKEAIDNANSPERVTNQLRADIELLQLTIDGAASKLEHADTQRIAPINVDAVAALQARLSPGTALLQYSLSESVGFVWLVDRNRVSVKRLTNTEQISADARALHAAITQRRPYRKIAARLSETLLPFLTDNDYRRLSIVPDGPLHYVPFAALPHPSTGQALIDSIELQLRPNGLLLDEAYSPVAIESVAVLADAIYSAADPRLNDSTQDPATQPLLAALGATRSRPTTRLPFSAVEAEAITKLAGDAVVSTATGASVTQAMLAAQLASRPDLLHVAAHGIVDMEHSGLSGLVLSAFTADGTPTNEFLSVPEIYRLGSTPTVVVLSACETAVGEYIRSEGPMSIANAFLQQGSDHVVATLWKVADRSTAELMTRFYEQLLNAGQSPAAALQAAQQQMKSSRRWRHPYYWAGFTATTIAVN